MLQVDALLGSHLNADKDRILGVLPFFHIFGLSVVIHMSLYWGIPLTVMSKFDLPLFCDVVQKHKISFSCLVPPILVLLAKHPLIDQYDLTSLKTIVSGAAPLSAELGNEVQTRLPTCTIIQGYGLTETSPVTTIGDLAAPVDGKIGFFSEMQKVLNA
jgi:acyl-CoA synthetase (AMP-forming)/AMP-acid ligase II